MKSTVKSFVLLSATTAVSSFTSCSRILPMPSLTHVGKSHTQRSSSSLWQARGAEVHVPTTTSTQELPGKMPESSSAITVDAADAGEAMRSERLSLDIAKTVYVSSVKAPKDAYIAFAEKGAGNAKMSKTKILHQSILGGMYVGFAGLLSLSIAGNLGGAAPGIAKMTFAALFPVNLLLILNTGGQLFTGNSATVAAAKYEGLVEWRELIKSWSWSLTGNVIGCGLFAVLSSYTGLLNGGTGALAMNTCAGKVSATFGQTLVKAILCNWMVSLAVFLAGASNDLTGKMVGIWFPISTFVGIGLEHSIANLFVLPAAILAGSTITVGSIISKNLVPVILGNAIAGALIMAGSYSYQFGALGRKKRKQFRQRLKEYEARKEAERLALQRVKALTQDPQQWSRATAELLRHRLYRTGSEPSYSLF